MMSKVKHMNNCKKVSAESKECARDNQIFSRGVDVLAHTPNPRCDTH